MKMMWKKMSIVALAMVAFAGCATGGGGPSDEEVITSLVQDAMTALAAQDIDAMTAGYADDFESDQGGGVEEMREFLKGAKEQGFLDGLTTGLDNLEVKVDGDTATAGPLDLEGAFGALTLELELEKRDGTWVVTYSSQY